MRIIRRIYATSRPGAVGLLLLLALSLWPHHALGATKRLAVMPFYNTSGEKPLEIWGKKFTEWVRYALGETEPPQFELPKWNDVLLALTNNGWKAEQEVTPELAEKVAASLRCTTLVLGEYSHAEGFWHVKMRAMHPYGAEAQKNIFVEELSASELIPKLMVQICASVGARPDPQTISFWREDYKMSDASFEKLLRLDKGREAAGEDYISALRAILASEPENSAARARLVQALLEAAEKLIGTAECTNHLKAALVESRTLVRQAGRTCNSHIYLAICLEHLDPNQKEYEDELLAVLKVHPGCPSATARLFPFWANQERWADVRRVGEEANRVRPGKAPTMAHLAEARLMLGDSKGAAELVSEVDATKVEDWGTRLSLMRTGGQVDNAVMARQLLWVQRQAATNSYASRLLADFDRTLKIPWLEQWESLAPPRGYSPEELKAELDKRLTSDERSLAISPLEVTDEIRQTALAITAGVTNQLLKVAFLFAYVTEDRLLSTAGRGSPAVDPDEKRACHYYASRLIALARAIGIPGWLVHVEVNTPEGSAYHDRAALVFGDRVCLSDPTWDALLWPVREGSGRILDDVQAIAHHLCQGHNLSAVRVGLKLDPDDVWTRCACIRTLAHEEQISEAEQLWNSLPTESTNRWDYYLARAAIDAHKGAISPALKNLKKADELSPKNTYVRRWLRMVAGSGDPESEIEGADRRPAWASLALERLATSGLGKDNSISASRGLSPATKALLDDDALPRFKQAAESGDPTRQEEYARKLLFRRDQATVKEGIEYLRRAARQGHPKAQQLLGDILYSGKLIPKDVAEAAQWSHLAAQSGDKNAARLIKEMELFADQAAFAQGKQRAAAFEPVLEEISKASKR